MQLHDYSVAAFIANEIIMIGQPTVVRNSFAMLKFERVEAVREISHNTSEFCGIAEC